MKNSALAVVLVINEKRHNAFTTSKLKANNISDKHRYNNDSYYAKFFP